MVLEGDKYSLARAFEGRTFGAYRIARAIATGGMATVFLARRTGPGRFAQTAALKVIHPHLAQEREFVEMFLEEARIASSINHPNVCRVLDFGQAEGTFYLAMEYVRGETWATSLERLSSLRESRVRLHALSTYVIAQACEGLHAVHEAVDPSGIPLEIVHRDISPQNLFIAYDGSVRVLDFGIASAGASDRSAGSTTQVIKGRYAYMAPEQARGTDVDRRADIWSLGVCLREALSGERLFARDTQVATILAVTKEPLPPWPKHVPLLLQEVCNGALVHDPGERYANTREFGTALSRFTASEAEPAGGAELGRWMRALFPEQIAQKRAELRELAGGEDPYTTGSFTSVIPRSAPQVPPIPAELRQTPPQGNRVRERLGHLGGWLAAGALSLGAAYLAFRITPQLMGSGAAAPAGVQAEVHAKVVPGPASSAAAGASNTQPGNLPATAATPAFAEEPEHADEAVVEAEPAQAAPGTSDLGAANAEQPAPTVAEDPAEAREHRHRHHRHRRSAEEREEASAPAAGESAGNDTTRRRSSSSGSEATRDTPAVATSSPKSSAPGTLLVGATSGWAEVVLDGRELGTTPFRVELPAGVHRLDVRFFGTGTPQPMRVEVKPGETTKLRLSQ
jgi:hypothetical protein